jgi:hypothetical protein
VRRPQDPVAADPRIADPAVHEVHNERPLDVADAMLRSSSRPR